MEKIIKWSITNKLWAFDIALVIALYIMLSYFLIDCIINN